MEQTQLRVAETFLSIQGESSFAGLPCFFIRLAGCNLSCLWCDTPHARNADDGVPQTTANLLRAAARYPEAIVEITGGEPLLQEGVYDLMQQLVDAGRTVLLETNGSVGLGRVPVKVLKIVDVKCPGSGMHQRMAADMPAHLHIRPDGGKDEVKYVLATENDFDWALAHARDHNLFHRAHVLLSPVCGRLDPVLLARRLLESGVHARLQLQLHAILWPGRSGV